MIKSFIAASILFTLSTSATPLITFKVGQKAKASEVNHNFTEINNKAKQATSEINVIKQELGLGSGNSLSAKVAQNSTDINELSSGVTSLSTEVDSLKTSNETIVSDLSAISTTLESSATSVAVAQNSNDINELSSGVTSLSTEVDSLKTSNETIVSDLSAISTTLESSATSVAVAQNSNDINELSSGVTSLSTEVDSLKTSNETIVSDLSAISTTLENSATSVAVAQNSNDINELSSGVTSLSTEVDSLKTSNETIVSDLSAISTTLESNAISEKQILANGVAMTMRSYGLSYYSIVTSTGALITVDAEGYPDVTRRYYESNDCSGTPYTVHYILNSNTYINVVRGSGEQLPNPRLNTEAKIHYFDNTIYYTPKNPDIVKLNYQSQRYSNRTCGTGDRRPIYASEILINDVSETGIEEIPLIFTGVGSDLIVTAEIGEASEAIDRSNREVYANGMRIGTVSYSYLPDSSSEAIYGVRLDNYQGQTVTISKDGSYSGFSTTASKDLYFTSDDCSSTPYVRVLNDYDKRWWDESKVSLVYIKNNDTYYELSDQVYKMTDGEQSYKIDYNGSCYSDRGSQSSLKNGYKMATVTVSPTVPVFTPPITIEGYDEPTQYDLLPEAM